MDGWMGHLGAQGEDRGEPPAVGHPPRGDQGQAHRPPDAGARPRIVLNAAATAAVVVVAQEPPFLVVGPLVAQVSFPPLQRKEAIYLAHLSDF